MAHISDLPCDGDGLCMLCKTRPSPDDTLTCKTCVTPWHLSCLSRPPQTMALAALWDCPDCCDSLPNPAPAPPPASQSHSSPLIAAIRAIQADSSLSDLDKARRRQQLLSGDLTPVHDLNNDQGRRSEVLDLLDQKLYCSICMQLPDRPVTVVTFLLSANPSSSPPSPIPKKKEKKSSQLVFMI